jgi:hypothetical protein
MPTGLDFVKRAMRIAGVLGQNETPSASEADDGLTAVNAMLALAATDRTYAYTITQSTIPVVNGQISYTVGTGGDFNITRPVKIDNVFTRINSVDYPCREINNQDYDSIGYKSNTVFPQYFYYDAAYPLGNLYIYGPPTQGDIYIDVWQQLTQFTSLATNLTFPPGYDTWIAYNLAKFIAPEYGVTLTPEATQIAMESAAMIRDRNLPAPVMKTELAYLVGNRAYNFWWG